MKYLNKKFIIQNKNKKNRFCSEELKKTTEKTEFVVKANIDDYESPKLIPISILANPYSESFISARKPSILSQAPEKGPSGPCAC
jgi:hypothetical protein